MLVAYEEVVEIYKTLALATTNGEAFNPDLAGSLNNLSNFLSGLGRREEATVASEKAVEIYITLAMTNSKAFNSDLARFIVHTCIDSNCCIVLVNDWCKKCIVARISMVTNEGE